MVLFSQKGTIISRCSQCQCIIDVSIRSWRFCRIRGFIMRKAMIFIDGRNFEHAVNGLYQGVTLIDYVKLTNFVATKTCHEVIRTHYYTAQGDKVREPVKYRQTQFFADALNSKDDFVAKLGRLEYIDVNSAGKPIYAEKQTDINIATDMLSLAYNNAYDTAVLLSADTDYIPVIRLIRQLGKRIVICTVEAQKSGMIKAESDSNFVLLKTELDTLKVVRN